MGQKIVKDTTLVTEKVPVTQSPVSEAVIERAKLFAASVNSLYDHNRMVAAMVLEAEETEDDDDDNYDPEDDYYDPDDHEDDHYSEDDNPPEGNVSSADDDKWCGTERLREVSPWDREPAFTKGWWRIPKTEWDYAKSVGRRYESMIDGILKYDNILLDEFSKNQDLLEDTEAIWRNVFTHYCKSFEFLVYGVINVKQDNERTLSSAAESDFPTSIEYTEMMEILQIHIHKTYGIGIPAVLLFNFIVGIGNCFGHGVLIPTIVKMYEVFNKIIELAAKYGLSYVVKNVGSYTSYRYSDRDLQRRISTLAESGTKFILGITDPKSIRGFDTDVIEYLQEFIKANPDYCKIRYQSLLSGDNQLMVVFSVSQINDTFVRFGSYMGAVAGGAAGHRNYEDFMKHMNQTRRLVINTMTTHQFLHIQATATPRNRLETNPLRPLVENIIERLNNDTVNAHARTDLIQGLRARDNDVMLGAIEPAEIDFDAE